MKREKVPYLGGEGREKEGKVWQGIWKYNKHECRTPVLGSFREII